jgi:hypothetical protein
MVKCKDNWASNESTNVDGATSDRPQKHSSLSCDMRYVSLTRWEPFANLSCEDSTWSIRPRGWWSRGGGQDSHVGYEHPALPSSWLGIKSCSINHNDRPSA